MKKLLSLFVVFLCLSGCAAQPEQQVNAQLNSNAVLQPDPLEPVNRGLWDFNWNILDKYLLRPTTVAYTTVMPSFARSGLRNAARNLEEPGNTVNNLFQGKGKKSISSLSRFVINSTIGLLGVIDVADKLGIKRQDEDFDETLAIWGINSGPFVMLPVLGPNDTRGVVGDISDNIAWPMTIISTPANIGRILINTLESRATLMAQEEQIRQSADDYAFVKNAYFQNKQFTINDGVLINSPADQEELDDFEDFESMLDSGQEGDGEGQ